MRTLLIAAAAAALLASPAIAQPQDQGQAQGQAQGQPQGGTAGAGTGAGSGLGERPPATSPNAPANPNEADPSTGGGATSGSANVPTTAPFDQRDKR